MDIPIPASGPSGTDLHASSSPLLVAGDRDRWKQVAMDGAPQWLPRRLGHDVLLTVDMPAHMLTVTPSASAQHRHLGRLD